MKPFTRILCVLSMAVLALASAAAQGQRPAPTTAQAIRAVFNDGNRKLLDMAKDFPADKYSFRLKPEMRTFGEVLVHIASGNVYAAKVGKGEQANWDELDPKKYPDKAAIVALMEKSSADAKAALAAEPDEALSKSLRPWLGVLEHSGEHYGLLVAYYRANGMVPPESRPKPKK